MRFIRLDSNKKIYSIRFGSSIVEGEIESSSGELGQILKEDGTFFTPNPEPSIEQPSLDEKMSQLQQDNLILMDALAVTFEEILNLKAQLGGTP
jgi:hypothetical protein